MKEKNHQMSSNSKMYYCYALREQPLEIMQNDAQGCLTQVGRRMRYCLKVMSYCHNCQGAAKTYWCPPVTKCFYWWI